MIETLFIQAKTKAGFESKVSAGEVKTDSIAFIEDTREIWTKGVYYPLSEIITVDSTPGESLLSCNLAGTTYKYRIGDECRFYDTEKQTYRFYKLLDIQKNKATWKPIEGTADLASSSLNGLMSKEDKIKLDAIEEGAQKNVQIDWNSNSGQSQILNKPEVYNKQEVDEKIAAVNILGVYKYKGSKPTYQDLPREGNEVGDVWNIVKTDVNYAWTGEGWDPLGGTTSKASATEDGLMSKEDFTKLESIAAGAQVNIKPDWNAEIGNTAEILNKPTIPSKVSELANDSKFINDADSDGFTYGRVDGAWGKIRVVFNNVSASSWVKDSTYSDYEFKCDLECTGVTENDYAEVVFDVNEASSGNYAPVCDTQANIVRIYSKISDTITIPTVVIIKK